MADNKDGKHHNEHRGDGHRKNVDPKKFVDPAKTDKGGKHSK